MLKLENVSFDFKTVAIIVTVAAAWFDQKTDNKMRDRDILELDKRVTKIEQYQANKMNAITTYNQVAVLANSPEMPKRKFIELNENE